MHLSNYNTWKGSACFFPQSISEMEYKKNEMGAEKMAQLVKHLLFTREDLGLGSQNPEKGPQGRGGRGRSLGYLARQSNQSDEL